jgi:hypothetical protein
MTSNPWAGLGAIAVILIAYWLTPKASGPVPTVTSTLEICDDVEGNTCNFGDPIPVGNDDAATHARMVDLIQQSSDAITAYDATHPPGDQP